MRVFTPGRRSWLPLLLALVGLSAPSVAQQRFAVPDDGVGAGVTPRPFEAPLALRGGQVLLYSQLLTTTSTAGVVSQTNTTATQFDNAIADDVTIPAGVTWTVQQVVARGAYQTATGGTAGTCTSAAVTFYSNAAGRPGAAIATQTVVPASDVAGVLTLNLADVTLAATATLEATYWVSVVCSGPNLNLGVNSRWNWRQNAAISRAPAQIINPNGGFGVPAGWSSLALDLQYSLSGETVGTALFPELDLTPAAIAAEVPTGQSRTATLTVGNSGTGDLAYSFPAFAAMQRVRELAALGVDVNRHERVLEASFGKGTEGLAPSAGNARQFRVGGPDAFGYSFIDSDEPGGPTYAFQDIAATGTALTLATYPGCPTTTGDSDDEGRALVALPFPFEFYGTTYTQAVVYANGIIGFDPAFAACTFGNLATIPNPAGINGFLAPFWDDLDLGTLGSIQTQALADGRFVIQYTNVPLFGSSQVALGNTFQVILSPDGSFVYQYGALNGTATGGAPQNGFTIGAESPSGTDGLLVIANTAGYARNGLAIAFAEAPRFIADVSPASGIVAAGGSQAVTVTLNAFETAQMLGGDGTPLDVGTYNRRLTLLTNDASEASVSVPVAMTVTPPPAAPLVVTPNPVLETLPSGEAGQETLTITNNTAAPITYSFPQYASLTAPPAPTRRVHAAVELAKGEEDPRSGDQPAFRDAGGPDAFGYQWADSDEPGGPVYAWTDIRTTGTPVTLAQYGACTTFPARDEGRAEVALPFAFDFYGEAQSTAYVYANGFIGFDAGQTACAFTNAAIPTAAVPNEFIAPFWDDLELSATSQIDTQQLPNGDFVIQWTQVGRFFATAEYTFQVILSPSGGIRYQYETMTGTTNSATVGIENADGTDGLQIAFNTAYAAAGKAVQIQNRPTFVTALAPASGTIPANSSQAVAVSFSAAGLLGGVYTGEIDLVTSLDTLAVGVELTVVGSPTVTTNPTAVAFGDLIVGFTDTEDVTITNNGSSALEISSITTDNPAFTVSAAPATIAPGASETITVTFTPTAPGAVTGALTIVSNASTSPNTVALSGTGLAAPAFAVAPSPLAIEVFAGQTATGTATLSNTGAGAGAFTALARLAPPTFTAAPPSGAAPASTGPERVRAAEGAAPQPTAEFRGGGDIVADGSFEAGTGIGQIPPGPPNPFWTEASTNFGTPLCTATACGVGTGTGPRTGTWWTWFGGTNATAPPEIGSMTQTVTIPAGTGELRFFLEIPLVAPTGTGFVRVTMDGTELFRATQTDNTPATYLDYREVVLDISEYADGGSHVLAFESTVTGGGVNFFIDDVSITVEEGLQLSVAPASGSVAAGGSQALTITVDASILTNADAGTYPAQLVVETNDPANPTITVPITVTVRPVVSNEGGIELPTVATLYQPFPNPMASAATVRFALPEAAPVRLHVYDVAGRLVSTLVEGERAAGFHEVALNARQMASGTYVVRMQAGEVNQTLRVSVVR